VERLKEEQEKRLEEAQAAGEKADVALKKVLGLRTIRGVAGSAWPLVMEFFGWREFRNGKEVGSCAGLTGTPYNSGTLERDQGISKAGNRRVRTLMIELSWCWIRYQGESKLSQWYRERFGKGAKRARRVGIVAVARRLLVALWRFTETGELPEGAVLKGAVRKG
jgi:transposase